MHELGMDTTNCNPNFGTPRNPHNREYYCGGSSGGSAYAVAAGLVPFAMGNDGGGSVRIPASYCGVYGLKTSHGRVSIRPTANLAKSNGVAGPIAANMIDLELAYRIMAHPDPLDDSSALFSPPTPVSLPSHGDNKKKALGIFRPWFSRADTPVQALCNAALDHLTSVANYSIIDIEIPMVHEGQLAHAMVGFYLPPLLPCLSLFPPSLSSRSSLPVTNTDAPSDYPRRNRHGRPPLPALLPHGPKQSLA